MPKRGRGRLQLHNVTLAGRTVARQSAQLVHERTLMASPGLRRGSKSIQSPKGPAAAMKNWREPPPGSGGHSAAEPQPNKKGVSIPVGCVGYPKTTHRRRSRNAMQEFIAKHRDEITGVLSGFDRLVFRGTLRSLSHVNGMDIYLAMNKVLRKDFGRHVQQVSERLKQASLAEAVKRGRPVKYLTSPQVDKEALVRKIATQDGIRQGLIGVLTSVELCRSFEVYRNRETKQLDLVQRWRKCLFLYHYSIHPRWGFMHARIQTWFPFSIQVCLNGREWLARQMAAAGLGFVRQDNCFLWVKDWAHAQRLLNAQLRVKWASRLDEVARQLNPAREAIFRTFEARYYWTTYQSEWATDVVFRRAATLRRLYPRLLHHAM